MASFLETHRRSHTCVELRESDIGKNVGDSVTAQLPAGKKTFEILEVNFPWSE